MSPIGSVLSKIHQAKVHVFSDSVVCGNARDERLDGQVDQEMDRKSSRWRNDYLERNQFEVPQLRVARQSRSDSDEAAGRCRTTRLLDERLHRAPSSWA